MQESESGWRKPWVYLLGALVFRYLCHSIMLFMALAAERRAAPTLPDAVLSVTPRVEWINRYNYHIWLLCYVPLAVVLGVRNFPTFLRFMVAGGVISLLRGVSILMTGLGPVWGPDLNAGIAWHEVWEAWIQLINPLSSLLGSAPHIHLTKDLFFSGHTATTFLLALYCFRDRALRVPALVAHGVVVAVVFLSHLHYTIDVAGAYAVTFSVYAMFEWRPRHRDLGDLADSPSSIH